MLARQIGWDIVVERLCAPNALAETPFDLTVPGPCQPLTPPASDCDSDPGVGDLFPADAVDGAATARRASPVSSERCFGDPTTQITAREALTGETPQPQLPPVPQLRNLPTPIGTPQSGYGLLGGLRRQPSMCSAMLQARKECMAKATLDTCPPPMPHPKPSFERRSSVSMSVSSLTSSPESMMSDDSTLSSMSSMSSLSSFSARSSRSSSISSACGPLSQVRLEGLPSQRGPVAPCRPGTSRMWADSADLALRLKSTPSAASMRPNEPHQPSGLLKAIAENHPRSPQNANDNIRSEPRDFENLESSQEHLQRSLELEAAACLHSLRSRPSSTTTSNEATPQPRPAASRLSGSSFVDSTTPHSHLFGALPVSQRSSLTVTPVMSFARDIKESTPARHKRTHSKANASLATDLHDAVRTNLRQNTAAVLDWDGPLADATNNACRRIQSRSTSIGLEEPSSPLSPPLTPSSTANEKASRSPTAPWAERCVPKQCGIGGSKRRGCMGKVNEESRAVEECGRLLRKGLRS
ncbi:MAG: hypothetical protein Q9227_008358 [Pyrenula ochraceoflavens]